MNNIHATILLFIILLQPIAGQHKPLRLSDVETQSALVINLSSNDTLFRYNEKVRMTPASLTKLFTTAASIAIIGADYRFTTGFYFSKKQNQLTIKGGGDPTASSAFFPSQSIGNIALQLSKALKNRGITNFNGNIVTDISYFGDVKQPSLRVWEDMANYYGALPSALSFADNTFKLYLNSPSTPGSPCSIEKMEPQWGKLPVPNVISRTAGGDSAYIYGISGCDNWYVSGSIPAGKKSFMIKGAHPEPHRWYATKLEEELVRNGITHNPSPVNSTVKNDNELIYTHYSPSLSDICAVTNKHSNNLYADHLLLALGRQKGKQGWDGATAVLNSFCRDSLGIFSASFYDGSGLSPFNSFSASDVLKLLVKMHNSTAFVESLPIGGIDGTSRNMWRSDDLKGKIRAKSGSMNGVMGYAGYINTADGRQLAFCIMVNHHTERNSTVKALIEKWVATFTVGRQE